MSEETMEQKLAEFIIALSSQQFDWLRALQRTNLSADAPKTIARGLFDLSARAGIRQSVAEYLVKVVVKLKRHVQIAPKEITNARFRAYEAWEQVGKQRFPPPPRRSCWTHPCVPQTPILTNPMADEMIHGFSRSLAREVGVKDAILLRFLAYHTRRSRNTRDGKKWYYNSIKKIADRFPYIPVSTVGDILGRLEEDKHIEVSAFNKWPKDRTRWYSMQKDMLNAAEKDVIYFSAAKAQQLDICEAVLHHNLVKNLEKKSKNGSDDIYQQMSPRILAEILPFSEKTIERGLKVLRASGEIIQKAPKSFLYTLPDYLNQDTSGPNKAPPEPETPPSKPDKVPSESGKSPSVSGDNTHYKPLIRPLEIPLETPFITPLAPPAGVVEQILEKQSS